MLYILSGVVFFVAALLAAWFGYQYVKARPQAREVASLAVATVGEDKECAFRRLLDGVCVESEEQTHGPVVGLMIENHFEARPMSGIADASVVYEAPVEGNIPRFLALYSLDSEVKKVGPVRSARPYYVDWLSEYGTAMYMHVGGSPEALNDIASYGLFDMNEFSRGWYFWRSDDRYAPHNTYTSNELWSKAWEQYAPDNASTTFATWKFEEQEPCDFSVTSSACIKEVALTFSRGTYEPVWKYNTSTEQYERYEYGEKYVDQSGTAVVADTVVVQWVEAEVLDAIGRQRISTISSGKAAVFRGGSVFEGEWKKESRGGRTRWFDSDGNEIPLRPGKIWIEVMPIGAKGEWK